MVFKNWDCSSWRWYTGTEICRYAFNVYISIILCVLLVRQNWVHRSKITHGIDNFKIIWRISENNQNPQSIVTQSREKQADLPHAKRWVFKQSTVRSRLLRKHAECAEIAVRCYGCVRAVKLRHRIPRGAFTDSANAALWNETHRHVKGTQICSVIQIKSVNEGDKQEVWCRTHWDLRNIVLSCVARSFGARLE
jgi:hypothetical protein